MTPALPGRGEADEDVFIASLSGAEAEAIEAAVRAAIQSRRPRLAGRLVGLLDEAPDDPEIQRAMQAARLLCHNRDPHVAEELDLLLLRLKDRRRRRFSQRSRASTEPGRRPNPRSRYRR